MIKLLKLLKNYWDYHVNDGIKIFIITYIIVHNIVSFFIGATLGFNNRCEYSNLASRVNVSYVMGCELFKPRFKDLDATKQSDSLNPADRQE